MSKVSIKQMTEEDIEKISPILKTEFDNFWTIENLKSEFHNPTSYCFVAIYEGQIVGFATIWQVLDVVHLNDIVTKKDFRNLGIGTSLLEHLINVARLLDGVTSMTLEVKESNIIAQKLYRKFNFEVVGIRKNYYGINENGVIMTKEL